jgi:hypothetical protein
MAGTGPTFTPESTSTALHEACHRVGLDAEQATLMRLGENALYRLASTPVVVRIARTMKYWPNAAKEVAVARWLAEKSLRAAEVFEVGDQPIDVAEHPVTFWRFIAGDVAMPDDIALLGRVLRTWHELEPPDGLDLPDVDVFARIEPRLEKAPVPDSDKSMLMERCHELREQVAKLSFPLKPTAIHGDAHIKNLMIDAAGEPVVLDFENVARGAPEWDLSMTATEYVSAGWWTPEQYSAFVDAYGFDITEWEGFETLRATHEIKMTTWIMQNVNQSEDIAAEYQARIHTIKTGEIATAWRPF